MNCKQLRSRENHVCDDNKPSITMIISNSRFANTTVKLRLYVEFTLLFMSECVDLYSALSLATLSPMRWMH